MKNILITLLLSFLLFFANSQSKFDNTLHTLLYDTTASYETIKKQYQEINSISEKLIAPSTRLHFSFLCLKNNDIETFKKIIPVLIEKEGFFYSYKDTLPINRFFFINNLIYENGLQNWMISQSANLYPIWIKNNYFQFTSSLELIRLFTEAKKIDLNILTNSRAWNQSFDLLIELQLICKSNNNTLPNEFDYGISGREKYIFTIIENCLFFDQYAKLSWEFILPYIDNAYFEGKIGTNYYALYDYALYRHSGMQYYGFIENAPFIDEFNLFKRAKKYDFVQKNIEK